MEKLMSYNNLTQGDNYIHFTKYGGVNKGVVEYISKISTMDIDNRVTYDKYYLINTNGIRLELDGTDGRIFKINTELTEEYCDKLKGAATYMGIQKQLMLKKIKEKHEKRG